ncbi:MAG: sarcosine oxidase subunit alpha family protein, partial [Pseudomonadales bacterium]
GIDIVGRSFKYSRPRGIVASNSAEPNAIVQLGGAGDAQVPNVRATQQILYEGLSAHSVKGWPSVKFDIMGLIGKLGGPMMGPGFYYKTFMAPSSMWMTYERFIRKAAGLGSAPAGKDPDIYDHCNRHCDVLVIGAGPAGLTAALAASRSGARVIICDEQACFGGSLLDSAESLDGQSSTEWVTEVKQELASDSNVLMLPRTTANGFHDHNFVTLHECRTEHLPATTLNPRHARSRMHHVRAKQVILATGSQERPVVYANNDIPGNMLCSAVSSYIRRYAVIPGKKLIVMTANDSGYQTALDWHEAGRQVIAIVDIRNNPRGDRVELARQRGLRVITGAAVFEAKGARRVTGARIATVDLDAFILKENPENLACDTIASSGGFSPVVHLAAHTGVRPVWSNDAIGFIPGEVPGLIPAGAVAGVYPLDAVFASGREAAIKALKFCGYDPVDIVAPRSTQCVEDKAAALFEVPHLHPTSRAPKQFVDLQNDVTAAAIEVATKEGFESIEHVKRYTAMGFGTDQGKLGNVNGIAIAARVLGQSIPETGTTVFRPNYTPVTFGAIVGRHVGELFDPERHTAMHGWHVARGALFENVGQWKRPLYFPVGTETMHEAVIRECRAVRQDVGVLDASTLGKIDVQGSDAREFLGRVYTNKWARLGLNRCRYGLMCKDDGMVMDDGVTSCLGENHFLMTTTTGGAANVLEWLELWHQTEWPELEVYFNSVTDHWATITLSGPRARDLLAELTDIDLARESFKFMDCREGNVADVPARVYRISFTGELTFEVNVQANYAMHVWEALFRYEEKYNLTPYGTETMHILRAEKGFIIVGQETDGSVTPEDLGMGWCVGYDKPFAWIGKRALSRTDTRRKDRKQLVGLMPTDPKVVLQEGAQLVFDLNQSIPVQMQGHVTSSYYSPTLGQGFAMALISGGAERLGQKVYAPLADGREHEAEIVSPLFLDPDGERQNV